jgi:hypothetical protein
MFCENHRYIFFLSQRDTHSATRTHNTMRLVLGAPSLRRALGALVLLVSGDALWFWSSAALVYPMVERAEPAYGLLAWGALAFALAAGQPALPWEALAYGASVGGVTYLVFNGTELALRPDWRRWPTPAVDVAWGVVLCAAVSAALHADPWQVFSGGP